MQYLTVRDIELLHMQIIDASGGSAGIRDRKPIEATVAAQKQTVFGEEAYQGLYPKAAALTRGIIQNHPFVDGNKRTGIMAALLLLELNKVDTSSIADRELEDFAVKVAEENLSIEQITKWLKQQTHNPSHD